MFSSRFFRKYLVHQFIASSAHGLHSPFVFMFYNDLLRGASPVEGSGNWEQIRENLKADHTQLQIVDLGAGSQLHKSDLRQISDIARNALKPARLARFLYRLVKYQQPEIVIELGTSLAITSLYMAGAASGSSFYTIEGSKAVATVARKVVAQSGLENLTLLTGNFDDLLPELISQITTDNFLLYIDGNHQKEATLRYFMLALEKGGDKTVIIFDDIHWSVGMDEAWAEIRKHPRVTITIDMFFMGIVYLNRAFTKEDFRLRYW